MTPPNVERRRAAARSLVLFLSAALALVVPASAARAQGMTDPMQSYRELMQRRMEMSKRAVDETQRRRFEDGKSDERFPSDANKVAAKPGVVRAVSPEEQKALAHNERGLDYFSKSKFEQAVKEYDEAIRIYPSLAAAHNNRGSAFFALSRFDDAAEAFRRAIEIDKNYGQAHFNLALTLIKLGREKEANDALAAAARAYIAAGDEHLRAGRLKEAEESYKGPLQIDPDYPAAHLRLGLVYNAARRFEEAVEAFRHVLKCQTDSGDAYENLGEAYFGLRKYQEAADASEQAIRLRPAEPGVYYIAGLAYASLGQRERALADLDKLKALNADEYAKLLSEFIEKKAPAKQ